jgi:hypothetical protein
MPLPEYHAVLVVDAERYSTRPSAEQAILNAAIEPVLEEAFDRADLAAVWRARRFPAHTGDGYVVGLPSAVLPQLVHPLLYELQGALEDRDRGRLHSEPRLRLRAAIHVGPLPVGGPSHDGVGAPMTVAHRLVDSTAVKRALADSHEDVTFLAAIVSSRVFEDVVDAGYSGLKAAQFEPVVATAKTFEERAYVHVPRPSRRAREAADPASAAAPPPPTEPAEDDDGWRGISVRGDFNNRGTVAGRDAHVHGGGPS